MPSPPKSHTNALSFRLISKNEEIEEGLILTYQSRPITDSAEITYDV